jgi:hypothetical protein
LQQARAFSSLMRRVPLQIPAVVDSSRWLRTTVPLAAAAAMVANADGGQRRYRCCPTNVRGQKTVTVLQSTPLLGPGHGQV